jgi:hypothetical protein
MQDVDLVDVTASEYPAEIEATWQSDVLARLLESGLLLGWLKLVEDWYEPGAIEPQRAWIVHWYPRGLVYGARALVELDGAPAEDVVSRSELAKNAAEVVGTGPPPAPTAFGWAATGLNTNAEVGELIRLTVFAVDSAAARVQAAAQLVDEYAVSHLVVAVAETLAWVRALDELMQNVWENEVSAGQREEISLSVDAFLRSPGVRANFIRDARTAREQDGSAYADWSIGLLARASYVPRSELQGLRWLAGKLLHHGALSAVERKQWREGEQPRWKWCVADQVYPPHMDGGASARPAAGLRN